MKKLLSLAMIFVFFGIWGAQAQENLQIEISPAFATAQEAVDFTNSLPEFSRSMVRFICEYHSGAPTESFYKVVSHLDSRHGLESIEWRYKEFFSPEEAINFVNENHVTELHTTCWNPSRNPAGTTIVLFYSLNNNGGIWLNVALYGPFASVELAASWANENACDTHDVDFLSSTNAARQTEPVWYVITYDNLHCDSMIGAPEVWRVHKITPDTESAIASARHDISFPYSDFYHIRLVPAFNTWNISGEIVLFVLEPVVALPKAAGDDKQKTDVLPDSGKVQDVPVAELVLPVRIFATKILLQKSGVVGVREIVNTALNSLYSQTNLIHLKVNQEIQESPQLFSRDAVVLGNAIPYVPNTLAILLTDQNLVEPDANEPNGRVISGRAGRSWVVVWVKDLNGPGLSPEGILLHEILHEFGVVHKQDPFSVMCQGLIIKSCPDLMTIDGKSLSELAGGVKTIKKIGFDTYTGLVTRH